ncbi:MAG TPA: NAD(P)-binding domain-containing protein, partial [Burkholderiales bacterium]|nr:NAD(P)-binding domain-containing protein [Burkholderiales bacterium]
MKNAAKTLNVIGAGRVGRTLGALWSRSGHFAVQDVLCRTPASAQAAVDFIGAGAAVEALSRMRSADVWLIATPDAEIAACCDALANEQSLRPHDIVFHCSGSLPAFELAAAIRRGADAASVHPL